jgi:hypothetical protein
MIAQPIKVDVAKADKAEDEGSSAQRERELVNKTSRLRSQPRYLCDLHDGRWSVCGAISCPLGRS